MIKQFIDLTYFKEEYKSPKASSFENGSTCKAGFTFEYVSQLASETINDHLPFNLDRIDRIQSEEVKSAIMYATAMLIEHYVVNGTNFINVNKKNQTDGVNEEYTFLTDFNPSQVPDAILNKLGSVDLFRIVNQFEAIEADDIGVDYLVEDKDVLITSDPATYPILGNLPHQKDFNELVEREFENGDINASFKEPIVNGKTLRTKDGNIKFYPNSTPTTIYNLVEETRMDNLFKEYSGNPDDNIPESIYLEYKTIEGGGFFGDGTSTNTQETKAEDLILRNTFHRVNEEELIAEASKNGSKFTQSWLAEDATKTAEEKHKESKAKRENRAGVIGRADYDGGEITSVSKAVIDEVIAYEKLIVVGTTYDNQTPQTTIANKSDIPDITGKLDRQSGTTSVGYNGVNFFVDANNDVYWFTSEGLENQVARKKDIPTITDATFKTGEKVSTIGITHNITNPTNELYDTGEVDELIKQTKDIAENEYAKKVSYGWDGNGKLSMQSKYDSVGDKDIVAISFDGTEDGFLIERTRAGQWGINPLNIPNPWPTQSKGWTTQYNANISTLKPNNSTDTLTEGWSFVSPNELDKFTQVDTNGLYVDVPQGSLTIWPEVVNVKKELQITLVGDFTTFLGGSNFPTTPVWLQKTLTIPVDADRPMFMDETFEVVYNQRRTSDNVIIPQKARHYYFKVKVENESGKYVVSLGERVRWEEFTYQNDGTGGKTDEGFDFVSGTDIRIGEVKYD